MLKKAVKQQQASMYHEISTILRDSNDSQCFVSLCHYDIRKREWSFCAIGTIYHHFEENPWKILFRLKPTKLLERIGLKKPPIMACPDCGARCGYTALIIHLNDTHRNSYHEIADLLDVAKPYDSSNSLYRKIIDCIKLLN